MVSVNAIGNSQEKQFWSSEKAPEEEFPIIYLEKPDVVTTFSQFECIWHTKFNNKHLTLIWDSQFTLAIGGQGHWFFQTGASPILTLKK